MEQKDGELEQNEENVEQPQSKNLMDDALKNKKAPPAPQKEAMEATAKVIAGEDDEIQNPQAIIAQSIPSLRIGIISTPSYREDLMHFTEVFTEINEHFEDAVTLVVFGYNGAEDMPELMDGIKYEHVKPVSMVHYFKQLKALDLDCVLIPLINNAYNATSENYNKYLEAGAFSIPVIVTDIYPYNSIIQEGHNGFLFKESHGLLNIITYLLGNRNRIALVGAAAYEDVVNNWSFTEENVEMVTQIYD